MSHHSSASPLLSENFFRYIYQKDKRTNKYKCNQTKMGRVKHYNTLPDYKTGAWVTIDIYKFIKAMFSANRKAEIGPMRHHSAFHKQKCHCSSSDVI